MATEMQRWTIERVASSAGPGWTYTLAEHCQAVFTTSKEAARAAKRAWIRRSRSSCTSCAALSK